MSKRDLQIKLGELSFAVITLLIGVFATEIIGYVVAGAITLIVIYLVINYVIQFNHANEVRELSSPIIRSFDQIHEQFERLVEINAQNGEISEGRLEIIEEELNRVIDNFDRVLRSVKSDRLFGLIDKEQVRFDVDQHFAENANEFKLPILQGYMNRLKEDQANPTLRERLGAVEQIAGQLTNMIIEHKLFTDAILGFHVSVNDIYSIKSGDGSPVIFSPRGIPREFAVSKKKIYPTLSFMLADIAIVLVVYALLLNWNS